MAGKRKEGGVEEGSNSGKRKPRGEQGKKKKSGVDLGFPPVEDPHQTTTYEGGGKESQGRGKAGKGGKARKRRLQ